MKAAFEFVEYYPFERPKGVIIGTCHVYDCAANMDIRGILVKRTPKGIKFSLPYQSTYEKGEKVFYPVISYIDMSKVKELFKCCRVSISPSLKRSITPSNV